ncbi:MAG TPA: hypothetical protein VD866_24740 [Urbifossiella sp.]|nr:hypothetical protein [Urbifossiella sp.]
MDTTRREFGSQFLGALVAYGLIETCWRRDLFAQEVRPTVDAWFKELGAMTADLRGRKFTDLQFQEQMEALYRRVDLPALCRLIKLDEIEQRKLPDNGALSAGFNLGGTGGLPAAPGFGKQIFGCGRGRSIVPHGHANMCTGFIILKGRWVGKHYDRVETAADHYLIRPTIDKEFDPGEVSTISDHKDNVHWFRATTDGAYIFNVHIDGYDPRLGAGSGRLYLDPAGERVAGGLVKAAKMSSADCHRKYG